MSLRPIAYLVSHNYDALLERAAIFQDEHAVLRPYFADHGFDLRRVDWQDRSVDWPSFACILPKAVWNYFEAIAEFKQLLATFEAGRLPLQNSPRTVLWNMDKRYLRDFETRGMPTVAFTLCPRGSSPDAAWFSRYDSEQIVIKPSVSGGSLNTIRLRPSAWREHRELIDTILRDCDLIVMPYAAEIETEGEYSFFFFGDQFSHALLKKPARGDFRAHTFYGGTNEPYTPSTAEIAEAFAFTRVAPDEPCYVRVDVLRIAGVFHVLELEMIEPYLYMEYAPAGRPMELFARAVVNALRA